MPRTAMSPNKGACPPPKPPKFTLAICTHYDAKAAYHRHRIPVVELCVQSIRDGAQGHDYELLIWDNGSSPDFRKKLATFNPDVLVLSPNIGKQSAIQSMVEIARGNVFCFSDDDIYYYPGWLTEHMRVLETYESNGAYPVIVSGAPQRTAFRWGMQTNMAWAQRGGAMQIGRFIPEICERQYARSIGRNEAYHIKETEQELDYLFTYRDVKAWAHAHHMQFVARRSALRGKLPPTKFLIDHGGEWDRYIDALGFLRLTTYERFCLHLGNELAGDLEFTPGNTSPKR